MERPAENLKPIDYANPLHELHPRSRYWWMTAVIYLMVALNAASTVRDDFRHRERTPAYIQYTVTNDWRVRTILRTFHRPSRGENSFMNLHSSCRRFTWAPSLGSSEA